MPSKTLLDYITTEQKKGISEASIRTQCLGAGWPPTMIDQAFEFLSSIANGPGSPTAVSLKKRSRLLPLIRVGFGLLSLKYLFMLVTMMAVTIRMEIAANAMLPFQLLKLSGWFYPSVIGLAFVASFVSLKVFFMLPQRTKSVWKKTLLSLILVVIIEIALQYLVAQFSLPLNEFTNSP